MERREQVQVTLDGCSVTDFRVLGVGYFFLEVVVVFARDFCGFSVEVSGVN